MSYCIFLVFNCKFLQYNFFYSIFEFKFLEYNLLWITCKLADKGKRSIHVK